MNLNYIRFVSNNIHSSIDEVFEALETARVTSSIFPLKFFLDVDFRNKVQDLVYYRDYILKPHLQFCESTGVSKDDYGNSSWMYNKLAGIEYKSFIQVMRVHKPWYGYSEAHKKKLNELAINMLNDII